MIKTASVISHPSSTAEYPIIGNSPAMIKVYDKIKQIGPLNVPVLIHGKHGTGKRLVAEELHREYSKGEKIPFISVYNGHSIDTITDPSETSKPRTIFINEIGETSCDLQSTILSILKEGKPSIENRTRIIATTSMDLLGAVAEDTFNSSLYYRINGTPIYIPSLTERKDDIEILAEHFLKLYSEGHKTKLVLTPDGLEYLKNLEWKGNVTELMNFILNAVLSSNGTSELNDEFFDRMARQPTTVEGMLTRRK